MRGERLPAPHLRPVRAHFPPVAGHLPLVAAHFPNADGIDSHQDRTTATAGEAGFSRFRHVTQTPVNVVLELRP